MNEASNSSKYPGVLLEEFDDVGDVHKGFRAALVHCLVSEDSHDEVGEAATVLYGDQDQDLPLSGGRLQLPLTAGVVSLQVHRINFLHGQWQQLVEINY